MDFESLFGLVIGFAFVLAAITIHGSLKDFVDVPGPMVADVCDADVASSRLSTTPVLSTVN